jgi:hypothetical protein
VVAAAATSQGPAIIAAVQRFLLFYTGVFALIALTASVAAGLAAADRILMRPKGRVVLQSMHRAVSLAGLGALVAHIVLEIAAHRSHFVDAVVPFVSSYRPLYMGLGTLASDLLLIVVATGLARRMFADRRPALWRLVHISAYFAWPLSILHGLLAGRTAKPYVDWSYGVCVVVAALALLIRLIAARRGGTDVIGGPVPAPAATGLASAADIAAALPRDIRTALAPGGRTALPRWNFAPPPGGNFAPPPSDFRAAPPGDFRAAPPSDFRTAPPGDFRTAPPGGNLAGQGRDGRTRPPRWILPPSDVGGPVGGAEPAGFGPETPDDWWLEPVDRAEPW